MNAQQREECRQVKLHADAGEFLKVLRYLTRNIESWLLHHDTTEAEWAVKTAIQHHPLGDLRWIEEHEDELQPCEQLIYHGACARILEIAETEYTVVVTFGERTVYIGYETACRLYNRVLETCADRRRLAWWHYYNH